MRRPTSLDDSPEGGGYQLLLETVAQSIESGAIRRADPELVAFHLWAYVHGLVSLFLANPPDTRGDDPDVVAALELLQRLRPLLRNGLRPDTDDS